MKSAIHINVYYYYFVIIKMYVLYSMNIIRVYNVRHVTSVKAIHCHPTPLPWPHGTVRCPSDVHFRVLLEIVGHRDTFHLHFQIRTYYSFHMQP